MYVCKAWFTPLARRKCRLSSPCRKLPLPSKEDYVQYCMYVCMYGRAVHILIIILIIGSVLDSSQEL